MVITEPTVVMPGVDARLNKTGFVAVRLHYSADPVKYTPEHLAALKRSMPGWKFRKEFEIDFTAQMGQPVFEAEALDAQTRHLRNPIKRMDIDDAGSLVPREHGRVRIYTEPRERYRYGIGMDVSEGVHASDSTIEVFETFRMEQVAEVADNRITPPDLARLGAAVARYYNDALVCCVRPMHGITVLRTMIDECGYTNLWHDRMDEKIAEVPAERLGWSKGEARSPRLMDPWVDAVNAEEVTLRSLACRDQHGQYIYDERGLPSLAVRAEMAAHLRLRHGDMVVGCALAYRACCDAPKRSAGRRQIRPKGDRIGAVDADVGRFLRTGRV